MDVNPPLTDAEKRFVLAEAIKHSNLPVEKILEILLDGSVQPDWYQMQIPYGRNLNQCRATFEALRVRQNPVPPQQVFQAHSYHQPPVIHQQQKQTKRKPPPDNLETSAAKRRISDIAPHANILPRPPLGSAGQGSSGSATGKKRGRPSKAAVAQRDADAIARGEVIAPVRTSSLKAETPGLGERMGSSAYQNIAPLLSPRPPMPSPITPAGYGTQSFEPPEEVGSPGSRKRMLPSSTQREGQSSFSVAHPDTGNSRSERSTYPNIISQLTDTIPTKYNAAPNAPPASSHQQIQILNPPVSSYGRSPTHPPTSSLPQREAK